MRNGLSKFQVQQALLKGGCSPHLNHDCSSLATSHYMSANDVGRIGYDNTNIHEEAKFVVTMSNRLVPFRLLC